MAWSWSHAGEAYAAAEENLMARADRAAKGDEYEQKWLLDCICEWDIEDYRPSHIDRWMKRYDRLMIKWRREAKRLGWQFIAERIWEKAEELATCDNGGWNAWCCPDGCHTVSFTLQETEEEEEEEEDASR